MQKIVIPKLPKLKADQYLFKFDVRYYLIISLICS